NGGTVVNVAPNASITAVVNETNSSSGDSWKATIWNISGDNCVDTPDHSGSGTFSESFTITAPSAAGTYSVTFTARANNTCGGGASNAFALTNSIIVCTSPPTAPTSASVDSSTVCAGVGNITLSAT